MPERVVAKHATNILSKACIIVTFYLDISFNEEIASMLSVDGKQLQLLLKNRFVPQRQATIQIMAVRQPLMRDGFPVAKSSVKLVHHIIPNQLISLWMLPPVFLQLNLKMSVCSARQTVFFPISLFSLNLSYVPTLLAQSAEQKPLMLMNEKGIPLTQTVIMSCCLLEGFFL